MEKTCRLLPDMYIMIAFMGSAFAGASASSHAFFSLSMSVAVGVVEGVGGGAGGLEVEFEGGLEVGRAR